MYIQNKQPKQLQTIARKILETHYYRVNIYFKTDNKTYYYINLSKTPSAKSNEIESRA